ncbi:unnamed protein product [Vitrella brassicaformis CCMP3155]|uniref:Uncharacterized protein n=1 Tax=Vitrella brassicaformis (strain CCMP3155) TaxID=1169540 RepID=A0A0G4FW29_VITBC|nr:unnamed protein product [Vitrella brassicaformis CCMP3155]|eukprot:CEM19400.1 unnamed protein product [Vitrella brassicaformis CCMP3155]
MTRKRQIWRPAGRQQGGALAEAASSSADGDCAADGGTEDSEAAAAVFKAIRMQGWFGISVPRELHVDVYAFVNPIWCLKPPLPSPLSGVVLQHHTELVIDYSITRQRRFWSSMAPQTAYELGQQMINLTCLVHRIPRTPDGAEGTEDGYLGHGAFAWCLGVVIALVEGHAAGRQAARDKEGPATGMPEGSLKSLSFEPVVCPNTGRDEINQLNNTNANPPAAAPSQAINLPALTEASGVHIAHSVIDGRGWAMPAIKCVSAPLSDEIAPIRPFVATARSLVNLDGVLPAPSQVAELLAAIPVGQRWRQGPLAKLRTIGSIKLYEVEAGDLTDGLRDLQTCLVGRGCSKSLDLLCVEVHRNDCHSLILNDYSTFKALASLIDATCSPSGTVSICSHPFADEEVRDIPLPHLLAYTRFDFSKLPACGLPLLNALLQTYAVSRHALVSMRHALDEILPSARESRRMARSSPNAATSGRSRRTNGTEGYSISIECADGWTPPPDAVPPEPPEIEAFSPIGLLAVTGLTVKSRIGLGVANMLLSKGAQCDLGNVQLMDMAPADVLDLLKGIRASQMPSQTLTARGDIAIRLAALMRPLMTSLDQLTMSGSETEARQVLISRGSGGSPRQINGLSLGFVSEAGRELIKAEDEREGITLGDYKDDLPSIKNLIMHLDVPSAAVVDPGTFILSSIWSALEVESISQLGVVLPQHPHLDALKAAMQRRFAPQRIAIQPQRIAIHGMDTEVRYVMTAGAHQIFSFIYLSGGRIELFMTAEHIAALRKAAFAYSSTGYLPSLPPDATAKALATDFTGRVNAASPMSVIDPPYTPRPLKAPLMSVMQQRGLAMEPMLRLHGGRPCLTSPSVIASAAQLIAVVQKTGKRITGLQLLYKATQHGHEYTGMLGRVGDATGLLFLVRANGDMDGCFIDESIQPPSPMEIHNGPRIFHDYNAAVLVFKASGASPPAFQSPSLINHCISVSRADNEQRLPQAKLRVGRCIGRRPVWLLGLWAPCLWVGRGARWTGGGRDDGAAASQHPTGSGTQP